MRHTLDLPRPDPDAIAHSDRLLALLHAEIERCGGRIPFDRYMEMALYTPGLGYYSAAQQTFGEGGDFVTAPELSRLFSRALARQAAEVLGRVTEGAILEFGAGSGVMASTILAELEALQQLPTHYYILELSGELRARQQQRIRAEVPHLAERVEWLDTLPPRLRGLVLANEVLDAMPVQRACLQQGELRELFVSRDGEGLKLVAEEGDAQLRERLEPLCREYAWPEGYCTERNLHGEQWVAGLAEVLEEGIALLIDYGYPRREYYHPQRHRGTLMCHYRHRAHEDALLWPGLQDITAHVDFTAMAEAALQAGLAVRGYTSQANFLLANGLGEMLAEMELDTRTQVTLAGQVKRLTMPGEMGELFKVMALGKGWQGPLRGFALRDDRARL